MTTRSGQCLCGAVRFTLTAEPLVVRQCWCRDCQHLAANGTVNLMVPVEALMVEGALTEFVRVADSGNAITCSFCPTCGSHLFARSDARPQFRIVRAGNLRDPSSIRPSVHIWTDSAPAWACLEPSLECVPGQPLPPGVAPVAKRA